MEATWEDDQCRGHSSTTLKWFLPSVPGASGCHLWMMEAGCLGQERSDMAGAVSVYHRVEHLLRPGMNLNFLRTVCSPHP